MVQKCTYSWDGVLHAGASVAVYKYDAVGVVLGRTGYSSSHVCLDVLGVEHLVSDLARAVVHLVCAGGVRTAELGPRAAGVLSAGVLAVRRPAVEIQSVSRRLLPASQLVCGIVAGGAQRIAARV